MSTEENEELVKFRFNKAREVFGEAELLVNNELWNLAVNRLYYACFYAASALLASKKIYTKTHSGTKQMFALHFIKTGIIATGLNDFYTRIFSLRQSGDYDDFCQYEEEDVVELMAPAKEFIDTIERILFKQ